MRFSLEGGCIIWSCGTVYMEWSKGRGVRGLGRGGYPGLGGLWDHCEISCVGDE